MDAVKDKTRRRLICLALVCVTVAVFWTVIGDHFLNYDDDVYVTQNPEVNRGLTLSGVAWAFTHFYAANWHPLTWISHMLDCQLFGLNAGAQHAVNLAFHAANTVLLFLLLNGMTGAVWRSAAVAALFALHPLHVESVAWISERKDVFSTFFGLLALLAYVRYVNESKAGKPQSKIWFRAALALFALGLMAKPMLVTLPFVMLLLDFWPLERISNLRGEAFKTRCAQLKILAREKWPFFALTLASCVVTFFAQNSSGAVAPLATHPGFRIANALVSYVRYIGKMVWPAKLAILYPLSPISVWAAAGAGAILLAVSIGCVVAARRQPYWLTGWLWYVGTLVPVIGLVQVGQQSFADRYTYLPLVGLFIAAVWGGADLMRRWEYRTWLAGSAIVVLLSLCAADTMFQLQFWKNGVALFGRALAVTTDNPIAQNDFASALSAAGQTQEALSHYAAAARLDPNNALIQNNFGAALLRAGNTNAAISRYQDAIHLQPDYADAYNNLGAALTGEGLFAEAISALNQALALRPDNAETCNNLGAVLALQGKPDAAIAAYRKAARLDPDNGTIHFNLGLELLKLGRVDEAAGEFSDAARLNPDSPEAQYQSGRCLAMLGQPAAAIVHLRDAARLRPAWAEPLDALAWILATDGDPQIRNGAEAVRLAEAAAALSHWRQPVILNTLAAAYAEAGRFDAATNAASRAIELAQQSGQSRLAAQIEAARQLYQQRRPFHHP
jgi:protein O-mannosyl-transferase